MTKLKGLHFVPIRKVGKPTRWFVYAWRGGPAIMTGVESPTKPDLTVEAVAALKDAYDDLKQVQPETIAWLARKWRGASLEGSSPEWQALAPSTRETWGFALNRVEERWGHLPLAVFDDPRMAAEIIEWRNEYAATPRAADQAVIALYQLLEFGRFRAKVRINVAAGIPRLYRGADRAEIIWTDDDCERFAWSALALNRPNVIDALDLANVSGMRRGDLAAVKRAEVTEHAIVRTALKKSKGRRRRAVIPLIPESRRLVAELNTRHRKPGVETLLVNSLGEPWTPGSLTQAFNEVRDHAGIIDPGDPELGIPPRKKHLHDCRGTFVTKLCRARLTDEEIGKVVAWAPENVANIRRTYVDDAAVVVALSERINRAL